MAFLLPGMMSGFQGLRQVIWLYPSYPGLTFLTLLFFKSLALCQEPGFL